MTKYLFPSRHLLFICIVAIIVRLAFLFTIPNLQTENYWEYGEIGKNILAGNGYSIFYFENDSLQYKYKPEISPFPSAYMPPGYVAFLLPFLTIETVLVRNIMVYFSHILISILTILLLYYYTKKIFSEETAIISAYVASLLPDFIYAIISFTPTIVFHFGTVLLLLLLESRKTTISFNILFGIMTSFLIYLRSEFVVFFFLIFIVFTFQREWKKIFIVISTVILMLSPWTIRNYNTFHSLVPFTTSAGLNLFRGNNADEIGAWGDTTTKEREKFLPRNEQFEIAYNAMFTQDVYNYITQHPIDVMKTIPVKIYDLWVFNRHSGRSNTLYNLYSFSFAVLFFIGLISSFSKRYIYLYFFFLYFTVVVTIFFCLPRYQTMMRIGMIPFAAIGIGYIVSFINRKK